MKRSPEIRALWVCFGLVALLFLCGGSARADIVTLPLVRLAAGLACAAAILFVTREQFAAHRPLLIFAALAIALTALHLVPLPPQVWGALGGRAAIVESDRLAGLGALWRPLSIAPVMTWNALYSLLVPAAVLLWAIQLDVPGLRKVMLLVLGLGGLSALIGTFQVIGTPGGSLYFYRITNEASAVGLFSNRNHHAFFLAILFPLLAWFASQPAATRERIRMRNWVCAGAGVMLVPVLLVAGSRAGLLLGALGVGAAWWIWRPAIPAKAVRHGPQRFDPRAWLALLAVFLVATLTFVVSRAEAVSRLFGEDAGEVRSQVWGPILQMGWRYFPFGSGLGSFAETYKIGEPAELIDSTYLNHAHNELLELWLTGGLPGLALAGYAGISLTVLALLRLRRGERSRPNGGLRATGAAIVLILLLASIPDYPLRTPSLSALFVLGIVCLRLPHASRHDAGNVRTARLDGPRIEV